MVRQILPSGNGIPRIQGHKCCGEDRLEEGNCASVVALSTLVRKAFLKADISTVLEVKVFWKTGCKESSVVQETKQALEEVVKAKSFLSCLDLEERSSPDSGSRSAGGRLLQPV